MMVGKLTGKIPGDAGSAIQLNLENKKILKNMKFYTLSQKCIQTMELRRLDMKRNNISSSIQC